MSVDVMALFKTAKATAGQLDNLLAVARNITRSQPEQYSRTVVSVLKDDKLARALLFDEVAKLEQALKELRAEVGE
jgi:aspartate/tyrosine/aromatic aminotransferase